MADNVDITAGAGTPIATDDIAGVNFQRIKITLGADGVNDGDVASGNPLPISSAALTTIASAVRSEDSTHVSGDAGIMALAVRADGETTLAIPNGDYSPLQVNAVGRLKVATQPGLYDLVTGNITANAQTVFCQVDRASNVMLHVVATSLVGHNATFEGSLDSTNGTDGAWFGIQVVRSNANTIETTTGVLAATPAYAWEASVNGLTFVRVRATAHTSGTATWKIQRGSYATEPIPAAQISGTQPVSGTVTATVGTSISGGTISPLTVAGASAESSAARTANGNSASALTNASGRNAHFIVNVSAVSGTTPSLTVRVQTQDPVSSNWVDLPSAASSAITTVSTNLFTVSNLPRTYRLAWTITGTTPSFTFSVAILPVI
jgi:hypothetical protein